MTLLPSRRSEESWTTASGLVVTGIPRPQKYATETGLIIDPSSSHRAAPTPIGRKLRAARVWLERSRVTEAGRTIFWQECDVGGGAVERRYTNPPLSQR